MYLASERQKSGGKDAQNRQNNAPRSNETKQKYLKPLSESRKAEKVQKCRQTSEVSKKTSKREHSRKSSKIKKDDQLGHRSKLSNLLHQI